MKTIGTNDSSCFESPRRCLAKEISSLHCNWIRISQAIWGLPERYSPKRTVGGDIDAHFLQSFTSPMIKGEILISSLYRQLHFAIDQRRDIESVLHFTDNRASLMINGEISEVRMPTLYRQFHFVNDQRRDIESFIIQTTELHRWSTARYRCLLYKDSFTSPTINDEIFNLYYINILLCQTYFDIHIKEAFLYIIVTIT